MSPRLVMGGTVLFLALGGVLTVMRADPVSASRLVSRPEGLVFVGEARESHPPEADYLGVILPESTVDIAPRVEGRLEHVYVHEGDTFKKGALLAVLDGGTARRDKAISEAQLGSMQAEQEIASLSVEEAAEHLQRSEDAQRRQQGAVSQDELATARYAHRLAAARLEAARAKVRECQARVSRLQQDVDETELRAPFDGVVASRVVDKGALVKPGQVLMRLLRSGAQRVRFALPEAQARQVSVGQRVLVTPQAQTPVLFGRVSHVSPEVDTAARRVFGLAELEPTSETPALPSGTVVRVRPLLEQSARRETP